MTPTVDQLVAIHKNLRPDPTEQNLILVHLVETELKRRKASGRPKSDQSQLERNAEAARKTRLNKKMKEERERDSLVRKNEKHDLLFQTEGASPVRKKKRTKNRQRWQNVPKVKPDRLHY